MDGIKILVLGELAKATEVLDEAIRYTYPGYGSSTVEQYRRRLEVARLWHASTLSIAEALNIPGLTNFKRERRL